EIDAQDIFGAGLEHGVGEIPMAASEVDTAFPFQEAVRQRVDLQPVDVSGYPSCVLLFAEAGPELLEQVPVVPLHGLPSGYRLDPALRLGECDFAPGAQLAMAILDYPLGGRIGMFSQIPIHLDPLVAHVQED